MTPGVSGTAANNQCQAGSSNECLARVLDENAAMRAELEAWRNSGVANPEEARRYRLLAELLPQLIWTSEAGGACNYVGPQWTQYTGLSRAALLGNGWLAAVHPEDLPRLAKDATKHFASGTAIDIDFRIRRADGCYRWFKTRATAMCSADGEIVQWVGSNIDIDELHHAEAEIRRLSLGLEREVSQRTQELALLTERHVLATSGAKVGIWDWNVVTDLLVWDPQMRMLFGLSPDSTDSPLETWAARVDPEDIQRVFEAFQRALHGEAEFDIKFRVQLPTGEKRHLHSIASVHREHALTPERIVGVTWDITREMIAQEALRTSEARWQLALQGTGDGVWDWDLVNNRIYLSHRSKELLGYDGEETTSVEARADLVHPDDTERSLAALRAHLRGEAPSFSCEYRLRRKDGSYIWILGTGRVIERDASGKPLRLVGTHKDIAERRSAEEALLSRKALLREFITHTPAAIAMLDRNMCYIQTSRRWLTDYKLDEHDIVGRSHYDVFPDIPERWKQIHQRVLGGAIESCDEDPFPRENGDTEWLQWEARPWHDTKGNVGGLIFFTQVITERKQLGLKLEEQNRQLSRSNAELEQFAYVASHDLQEPLRAITGCTQLLARRYRGRLDADADQLVEHIVEGAARMHALIEGLLSLSRVSSNGHIATRLDVSEIVEHALQNLNASIKESGARVTCGALAPVRGDPTQVLQLFQNLVGNALKYTRGQPPEVTISACVVDSGVQFSVQDNGLGIEPQYFGRIFGVFQRLHTRQEYPGTGIGLAICRKIVERHGGRIWLDSEPGVGTTFHFTLPA